MEDKYLVGIIVVVIAVVAIAAYALTDSNQNTAPVSNITENTTNTTVNETVNDTANDTDEDDSDSGVVYYASKETTKFHKPGCEWAQKISSDNLVTYNSRDAAIAAGKSPCQVCNP